MEAFFSQYGIYASTGQLYKPVDAGTMAYYREAKDEFSKKESTKPARCRRSSLRERRTPIWAST